MAFLADTNLLLRGAQDGHPVQEQARQAVRYLLARGEDVFLVRQNLVEFWVVATRPADQNELGRLFLMTETLGRERGIVATSCRPT